MVWANGDRVLRTHPLILPLRPAISTARMRRRHFVTLVSHVDAVQFRWHFLFAAHLYRTLFTNLADEGAAMRKFRLDDQLLVDAAARQISDSLVNTGDDYRSQVATRFAMVDCLADLTLAMAWGHLAADAAALAVGMNDDERNALEQQVEQVIVEAVSEAPETDV